MSMAAIRRVFEARGLKHGLKILLLNCAWHANADGEAWQGIDTMAKETGLEERQVGRNIEALIKLGLIERKRRHAPDKGGNIRRLSDSFKLLLDAPALAKMSDSSPREMSDSNLGAGRHSGRAYATSSDALTDISAPVYRKNPVLEPSKRTQSPIVGDLFPDESKKRSRKKETGKQKAAIRESTMPADWPDSALQAEALNFWREHDRPDLVAGVDHHCEQAKNHHAAKGSKFVDWDAAWRTWFRNAIKFERRSNGSNRGPASIFNAGRKIMGELDADDR